MNRACEFALTQEALTPTLSNTALTPTLSQRERGYITLPYLCSLAKREEEIFIPGQKDPILFEKGSIELMLFQKIRDESHRFAIGFNRTSRNKAMKKNILEELP